MFLAIDLGSTSFKAALFSPDLKRLGESAWKLAYLRRGPAVELAEGEVEEASRRIVSEALSSAGAKPADVQAIGVTSQAQTFALATPDMRLVTPFISWLDRRGAAVAEMATTDPRLRDFAQHAACRLSPALQICQVKRLLMEHRELAGTARIVPLPTYLSQQLCGKALTDTNLAAMSGFFSLPEGRWWAAALRFAGIVPAQLPELHNLGVAAATTIPNNPHGFPAGLPVFAAGNDQTAGAYGAELHRNGATLLTLGTAQVAYRCVPELPSPQHADGHLTMRGVYPGGRFYRLAVSNFGGALIDMALKAETALKDYPHFFRLAETAPPVPPGAAVVIDATTNVVSWSGQGLTPEQKARLVLERLCDEALELLAAVATEGGPTLCAGGGAANAIWLETLARRLGTMPKVIDNDPLQGVGLMIRDALS